MSVARGVPSAAEVSGSHPPPFAALGQLFDDPKYSDLTIKCGERSWHGHKAIVCSQCKFFEKACDGGFQEAAAGCIELRDTGPEIVAQVLRFLYTADYDDNASTASPMIFNVRMHTAADFFDLPALLHLAETKFKLLATSASTSSGDNAIEEVEEIYDTATDSKGRLREILVDAVFEKPGRKHYRGATLADLFGKIPDFGHDVTKKVDQDREANGGNGWHIEWHGKHGGTCSGGEQRPSDDQGEWDLVWMLEMDEFRFPALRIP